MDIGCCGFGMAQNRYFDKFGAVEIQQTFYEPPRLATVSSWRDRAPRDFHFSIKAWQLITHAYNSTTYRRLKRILSDSERTECGSFSHSAIVAEAWQITSQCARILEAKTILFQCPASFVPTAANIKRMERFFGDLERPEAMELAWEPRGDWEPGLVEKLCARLQLVLAVDPFSKDYRSEKLYFRLHGRGGWRYSYTDEELQQVAALARSRNVRQIFFNNSAMIEDAEKFALLPNIETGKK
jgi:uncharacterized protein YecE (DUF72 family)